MGRLTSALGELLAKYHAILICAVYLVLLAAGFFARESLFTGGPSLAEIALFGLLFLFLSWRLALSALLEPAAITETFRFELSFLTMVVVLIVLQAGGGINSEIFPIFYLLCGLLVAYLGFVSSFILTIFGILTFTGYAFFHDHLIDQWTRLLTIFGISLVFTLTIGLSVKIARDRSMRAQRRLYRLTSEARQLALQRSTGVGELSRETVHREEIGSLLQIERVLGDLAEITKRAMTAHSCLIAFIDEESGALYMRSVSSEEKPPDDIIGVDLSDSLLMSVVESGENLIIEDLGRILRGKRFRTWGMQPRALLAAPLIESQQIIGVIAADHPQPYHFGIEEEHFLEMMARRTVEAIGRERQYRHVSAEKKEIAAFYDIIKKLGASIDLENVSRVILESGQAIYPYDFGVLARVDLDNGNGQVEAVAGLEPSDWLGKSFALQESLVGWVVGSKTYVHYPNLRKRTEKSERRRQIFGDKLPLKNVESLLCLPLVRRNFVTGMLVFGVKQPEAFSAYEIKLFEVLAVQAAVSLENAYVHAHMEKMATTDGLTGCYNHRYFQEWLDKELARTRRMPYKISLLIADIDHFKQVNDTYGHPVGDLVLKTVSHIMRTSVRQNDLAARYGGEEFALVLLHTDRKGAIRFAERVREKIAKAKTRIPGKQLQVTVSMGVATYPDDSEEKAQLIELADQALYTAKQQGRNRVIHAQELSLHKS